MVYAKVNDCKSSKAFDIGEGIFEETSFMPSFQVYLPRGLRPLTISSPTERAPIARGAFFHVAYPILTVSQTASCSQEHP